MSAAREFPVVELYSPVLQGEGPLAGMPTSFVRLGLCDFRCRWCDSMHAVDPAQVKENATPMTADDIVGRLDGLEQPDWVTLSGGNPVMHDLEELVGLIHAHGWKVAVETQGSLWRDWLTMVDCLVVSPKPPSAGMGSKTVATLAGFMDRLADEEVPGAVKVVVFDDADLEFAAGVFARWPGIVPFLSCGTDPPIPDETIPTTLVRLSTRYAWLSGRVAADKRFRGVRALPQLHVLAYGHARGV